MHDSSIFSEWLLAINTLGKKKDIGKKKDNFLLFEKKKRDSELTSVMSQGDMQNAALTVEYQKKKAKEV